MTVNEQCKRDNCCTRSAGGNVVGTVIIINEMLANLDKCTDVANVNRLLHSIDDQSVYIWYLKRGNTTAKHVHA